MCVATLSDGWGDLLAWDGVVRPATRAGVVANDPHLPHAARSFGLFAKAEALLHDPLNRIIEILTPVLPVALFTFGVSRSGLDLLALTPTTGTILLGFWLSKPLSVLAGALLDLTFARAAQPKTVKMRYLCLIAVIPGSGFTVPALAIDACLPGWGKRRNLLAWPRPRLAARSCGRRPACVAASLCPN
jgi:NhaA family Na+:H+ antiporter